jgi:hypothetical protein
LQLLTVVYDPTIARRSGIISNATHLGLDFRPHIDPETHEVTGVLFRKLHGKKLVISVSLYDKWVSHKEKQQDPSLLTEAHVKTMKESVREDVTLHSEAIILLGKKAQSQLRSWGKEGLEFFDFLAPEEFLAREPKANIWCLQRSIYIVSHHRQRGKLERFSFGVWLVPYVEDDVLHFDVIAGITADGLHRMRGLRDPVAEAWRKLRIDPGENWAERLAQAAKCSVATVYSRRDLWWKEIGINIAFPLQLVIDVLYFGQASMARPESLADMLAAVKAEDGRALLHLHTEALADFEHKRVTILNPALMAQPRFMPLESPTSSPSGVDDDEHKPEDRDFLETGFIEEQSDSESPAKRPFTLANAKPTSPLTKVKLGKAKLGKKSPNLKGAPPRKLGRPKPLSKS